ncbi:MAG: hypothetical protein Q8P50_15400 [Bacillota bacterium]|nr:hypothetical protein [Bacillota bacterium]
MRTVFGQRSLDRLRERLGYEALLLLRVSEVAGNYPRFEDTEVSAEFDDTGVRNARFGSAYVTLGSGKAAAKKMVALVSPLIVSCLHKTLDMFIEWLLCSRPGATYASKAAAVRAIDFRKEALPPPLDTRRHDADLMAGFYLALVDHRHAITHGAWGTVDDQDLQFDFTAKCGKHIVQAVTRSQLADASCLVGRLMTSVLDRMPLRLIDNMILDWLADRARPLVGEPARGVLQPRYRKVRFIATKPDRPIVVDLDRIRKELSADTSKQVIFDLVVVASRATESLQYFITVDDVPSANRLVRTRRGTGSGRAQLVRASSTSGSAEDGPRDAGPQYRCVGTQPSGMGGGRHGGNV